MIHISFEWEGTDLASLDAKLTKAVAEKLTDITNRLETKVMENLHGKILQKVSGQLAGSVAAVVNTENSAAMTGMVVIDPETPKAWALEKGGEAEYPITAIKGEVLRFLGKSGDIVFRKSVMHLPSRAFGYLSSAAAEIRPLVPEEFQRAIQEVLDSK